MNEPNWSRPRPLATWPALAGTVIATVEPLLLAVVAFLRREYDSAYLPSAELSVLTCLFTAAALGIVGTWLTATGRTLTSIAMLCGSLLVGLAALAMAAWGTDLLGPGAPQAALLAVWSVGAAWFAVALTLQSVDLARVGHGRMRGATRAEAQTLMGRQAEYAERSMRRPRLVATRMAFVGAAILALEALVAQVYSAVAYSQGEYVSGGEWWMLAWACVAAALGVLGTSLCTQARGVSSIVALCGAMLANLAAVAVAADAALKFDLAFSYVVLLVVWTVSAAWLVAAVVLQCVYLARVSRDGAEA